MIRRGHTRGERGFAVPTVLFMILGAFSVAMVVAVVSVSAQRGTVRDADSKTALAVAEAGVAEALLRYNRVPTSALNNCVGSTGGTISLSPAAGTWCSPSTGGTSQGSFKYWVEPEPGHLEIVSLGESNGVERRIQVPADSVSGQGFFSDATVKSLETISADSNAEIRASTATNGDINLMGNARLCGNGSVGVGRSIIRDSNAKHHAETCTGTGLATQKPLTLPPVNQGDAVTVNSNGRFFTQDLRTGGDKVSWTPATRALNLSSNSSLTLGGSVYSVCRLTMSSNTALYIAPGADVTIYFDSPEACGLPAGTPQLSLSSNSRITATAGGPANVALLMVGSQTIPTSIVLNSNTQVAGVCEQNFVIYAPRTDVSLNSNATYCGALAAKSISMSSDTKIFNDAGARNFALPNTAPHYAPSGFIECGEGEPSPPDAGC